jgi:hypothetical protein
MGIAVHRKSLDLDGGVPPNIVVFVHVVGV